jgi:hypothetical protein
MATSMATCPGSFLAADNASSMVYPKPGGDGTSLQETFTLYNSANPSLPITVGTTVVLLSNQTQLYCRVTTALVNSGAGGQGAAAAAQLRMHMSRASPPPARVRLSARRPPPPRRSRSATPRTSQEPLPTATFQPGPSTATPQQGISIESSPSATTSQDGLICDVASPVQATQLQYTSTGISYQGISLGCGSPGEPATFKPGTVDVIKPIVPSSMIEIGKVYNIRNVYCDTVRVDNFSTAAYPDRGDGNTVYEQFTFEHALNSQLRVLPGDPVVVRSTATGVYCRVILTGSTSAVLVPVATPAAARAASRILCDVADRSLLTPFTWDGNSLVYKGAPVTSSAAGAPLTLSSSDVSVLPELQGSSAGSGLCKAALKIPPPKSPPPPARPPSLAPKPPAKRPRPPPLAPKPPAKRPRPPPLAPKPPAKRPRPPPRSPARKPRPPCRPPPKAGAAQHKPPPRPRNLLNSTRPRPPPQAAAALKPAPTRRTARQPPVDAQAATPVMAPRPPPRPVAAATAATPPAAGGLAGSQPSARIIAFQPPPRLAATKRPLPATARQGTSPDAPSSWTASGSSSAVPPPTGLVEPSPAPRAQPSDSTGATTCAGPKVLRVGVLCGGINMCGADAACSSKCCEEGSQCVRSSAFAWLCMVM